jgi:hypothetical protein
MRVTTNGIHVASFGQYGSEGPARRLVSITINGRHGIDAEPFNQGVQSSSVLILSLQAARELADAILQAVGAPAVTP